MKKKKRNNEENIVQDVREVRKRCTKCHQCHKNCLVEKTQKTNEKEMGGGRNFLWAIILLLIVLYIYLNKYG